MAKVQVYNLKGEQIEELKLADSAFGLSQNDELLKQAYVAIASNKRQVIAHAKDRAERAGSGKKPWKQKGTGRARVGQVRNPLWRKGGVVFGPTNERNFKKSINKKMNSKAIAIALSLKAKNKNLIVLDEIKLADKKTKEFAKGIQNLKIKGKTLIGFLGKEIEYQTYSRNIKNIQNIPTENMNVFDLMNNKNLVLSKNSVKYFEEKYKSKK
jgi:large subunit ribosomal protein L4